MGTKKSVINIIWSLICFALAVAAFGVMIDGTALHIIVTNPTYGKFGLQSSDYTCMDVAYGFKSAHGFTTLLDPSPWLSLVPFLLLLGAILAFFTALENLIKRGACIVFSVLATLLFVGAGVLFFLNGRLFVLGDYFCQKTIIENVLKGNITFEIGEDAITAGILSFVAAALTAVKSVLTITKLL